MATRTTRSTRSRGRPSLTSQPDMPQDKENSHSNVNPSTQLAAKSKLHSSKSRAPKEYCLCRKPDDRSPMILCSECNEWYHFGCIELSERDAEEIHVYVCPSCTQKTGLHTVMEWEGPEALENRNGQPKVITRTNAPRRGSTAPTEVTEEKIEEPQEQESSDDGSEDDYVAELAKAKSKGKRRTRRVSVADSDDSDSEEEHRKVKRVRRGSMASKEFKPSKSPGPSKVAARRKQSNASAPDSNRQRSMSTTGDDAARKYCLSKLEEMFTQIFLRYPVLSGHEPMKGEEVKTKTQEELTPEEKESLEGTAKRFTAELEQCMFNQYAELDKNDKPSAAGKYKERFRMLTFNLSKPDRVNIHTRIAASQVTPQELTLMSSTDLANDEIKQSIKQAEEESLAHSILKKATLPRAKMTHKGMQDIEDISGSSSRDREAEREQEDEDRMERERLARLRLQAQRAQSQSQPGQGSSDSVPPESPIVAQTPTWGGPPPLPSHVGHSHDPGSSPVSSRPLTDPLFVSSASDIVTSPVEGELNLADLINIDDDPTSDISLSISIPAPPPPPTTVTAPTQDASSMLVDADQNHTQRVVTPVSTTALSPFAARPTPDLTHRHSFDLNALWSPREETSLTTVSVDKPVEPPAEEPRQSTPSVDMDLQEDEADDQDFDMFLGKDDEDTVAPQPPDDSPEAQRAAFEALPKVWSGKMGIPLDSTIPQEVSLVARQSGGRTLGGDSPLWQTLFPTDHLRIDGRVPVDKSALYLTQMRLNPAKELFAVAFSPDTEASSITADTLIKYLIAKGRHGLVFPWGGRPKEHHPGRELYIIPLLHTDPIPEYMELLDNLQLPKLRIANYLIGIWILTKGKLAPPPAPPVVPAPVIPAVVPQAFGQPSMTHPTSLPGSSPPLPPSIQHSQPVSASALAAEVASLTQEQIHAMLRTLSGQAPTALGVPPVLPHTISPPVPQPGPPHAHIPPVPPQHAHIPPGPPHQPWNNGPLGYPSHQQPGPGYPPTISPPNIPPRSQPPMSPPKQFPHSYEYDRPHDRGRPPYPPLRGGGHPNRGGGAGDHGVGGGDRGYRGGRGNGGGRGSRARGFDRPRDAGWKGRGRGGGGSRGAASPTREGGERWDRWD